MTPAKNETDRQKRLRESVEALNEIVEKSRLVGATAASISADARMAGIDEIAERFDQVRKAADITREHMGSIIVLVEGAYRAVARLQ